MITPPDPPFDGRPMSPPQQERSETSTQRLLDAAMELLAESGSAGMTFAAIGQRAGYSRGLVTSRFGSKENLLRVLSQLLTERWRPLFEQPPQGPNSRLRLLALVRAVGEEVASDPVALRAMQRLIFERAVRPVDELQRWFVTSSSRLEREVASLVRQGIRDGSIRPDAEPELVSAVVVASLRGISYQWFLHPVGVEMVALHSELAHHLDRSLAPGIGT